MRNYLELGQWNVVCDRCGFKFKSDALKKEWTGLMVCTSCWESRHPQTLLNVPKENPSVPWAKPEPEDVFVQISEIIFTENDQILFSELVFPINTELN